MLWIRYADHSCRHIDIAVLQSVEGDEYEVRRCTLLQTNKYLPPYLPNEVGVAQIETQGRCQLPTRWRAARDAYGLIKVAT